MSEEMLDWQEALGRVLGKRELYVKLLGKFMESERDTAAKVAACLAQGDNEEARNLVHGTKGSAANLGAKALAAAALELEMNIRAGADTAQSLQHFSTCMTDTLLVMHGFVNQ